MKLFDLLSLIIYNLNRRKGRVILTAVGVVIGTAAVVILVSLANGLQASATSQLGGMADLSIIEVMPNWEEMQVQGPIGSQGMQPSKMLTTSAIDSIAAIPNVEKVVFRDSLRGMAITTFGRLEAYPMMMGLGVDDIADMGYQMRAGTSKLEKGTVLVGAAAVRQFMDPKMRPGQEPPTPPEPEELLDQQLRISIVKWSQEGKEIKKTYTLRVTGIIKESRREGDWVFFTHPDDMKLWNEWIVGKRINRNQEGYENVTVKVDSIDNVLTVAEEIDQLGFMAYTPQSAVQGISNFYLIIQVIFGGVGAVALIVAAIGIANTMAMAILERTREIGLMKAIGATNRDVLSIFLGEAAGIGFVGGLGGVAAGYLVNMAINAVTLPYMAQQAAQMGAPPPDAVVFTPLWLPVFAVLFATLVGLISGLYPALRAATIVPVLALKYE